MQLQPTSLSKNVNTVVFFKSILVLFLFNCSINIASTTSPQSAVRSNDEIGNTSNLVNTIAGDNALNLDGINDYVAIPHSASLAIGSSPYSVEFWFQTENQNSVSTLIAKRQPATPFNIVGVRINDGTDPRYVAAPGKKISFVFGDATGTADFRAITTVNDVVDGDLHHFSGVVDPIAETLVMYIDGVLQAVSTISTGPFPTIHNSEQYTIGQNNSNGGWFDGTIDELRIWNTARTQSEIQNNMNIELTGNETGLAAYYNFNQGVPSGDNTGLTTLNDATINGNNGTLNNFALIGNTSNWVNSTVFNPPVAICQDITVSLDENGQAFIPNPSEIEVEHNALNFDGTDDYVATSAPTITGNDLSIQLWVNPNATQNTHANILSTHTYNGLGYTIEQSLTTINEYYFGWGDGTAYNGPASFNLLANTWQHLSITKEGNQILIYIDGALVNSFIGGNQILDIGVDLHIGSWGAGGRYFAGSLDDVRIWDRALTSSEIETNYNTELVGNETDLLSYYRFNNTTSPNDVLDYTNNGNHGVRMGTTGSNNLPQYTSNEPTGLINLYDGLNIDNGSTASTGVQSMTLSQNNFDCSNVGDNIVTLTLTDDAGNTGTCTSMVTVISNSANSNYTELQKILASDGAADNQFGRSVSIDGNRAIIGALRGNNGNGSAYIYEKNAAGDWIEMQELSASDGAFEDYFGHSVSIDGNRAIVGAYLDDHSSVNAGSAYIYEWNGTTWLQTQKLTASDAVSLDLFGASVSIDDDWIVVGANRNDDNGIDSGSAYTYHWNGTTWLQTQKLTASDAAADDIFGFSTMIDGNRIVVGAFRNDDNGNSSGSVYVYEWNGTTWVQTQQLIASDATAEDWFGYSVSISNDIVVVGALGYDYGGNSSTGSAYVYKWNGTTWVQTQQLIASDATAEDWFGWNVDIFEDKIVIGSLNNDENGLDSGSAYVYIFDGSTWVEIKKLVASDLEGSDQFGVSVSISDKYIIVGSWLEDSNGTDAGAAYFFETTIQDLPTITAECSASPTAPTAMDNCTGASITGTTTTNFPITTLGTTTIVWSYTDSAGNTTTQNQEVIIEEADPPTPNASVEWAEAAKALASDGTTDDWFGYSVSISGDYAIVGALNEDTGGTDFGAAYIFKRDGSTWIEEQKIQASDKQAHDEFGRSVSISGDYAIVSAIYEDTGGLSAGAVYIFKRTGTIWTEQQKIQASDKQAYDWFGFSVFISGDYIVVGSRGEDTGGNDVGAAYIFKHNGTIWTEQQKIQASDKEAGDRFGSTVSISGDYAIVGALNEGTGGNYAGAAYIFKRNGTTWIQEQKLQAADKEAGDNFGYSVSIWDDYAVVGALYEDTGGTDVGAAYIFKQDGMIWTEQQKIQASDKEAGDDFGYSVSIWDDYVVVGARSEDTGGNIAGAAYIFKRTGATWIEEQKIQASDKEAGDYFGYRCSISDDYMIIGAVLEDTGGSAAGAAYIFELGASDLPTITAQCSASPTAPTATDNCTGATITGTTTTIFPITTLGTTTIEWTYTDSAGNTTTQNQEVIIEDTEAPMAICQDITVNLDASGNASITAADIDNGSTDACGIASLSIDIISFDCTMLGANIVTLTIMDVTGNSASCTSTVNVISNNANPNYAEVQKILASDGASEDKYGYSVSIDGDWAVIGAYWNDNNGTINTGGVYVYQWDGGSWIERQKLIPSDSALGHNFGESVSISGNRIIAGAWGDDEIENGSGAAYIFERNGTTWVEMQKLTASDGTENDTFGESVHLSGNRAIIGAFRDSDNAFWAGSAYIFEWDGTTWVEVQKLTASDGAADDSYGYSVSIAGNRAIVGAYADDDNGSTSGSAYIYEWNGTTWLEIQKIQASNGAANDFFGESVSIEGDWVIVGAQNNSAGGITSGTAYIYNWDGTTWIESQILYPSDIVENERFGNAVDISGDKLIVGAHISDAVYVFERDGSNWTEVQKVIASDFSSINSFGSSVSISDNRILVGAWRNDINGINSGSAYIYELEYTEPTISAICQDLSLQLASDGTAAIDANDINNGSIASCGLLIYNLDQTSFDCTNIGTNTVILTATDATNNSATCTSTVTVEDNVAPIGVCQDVTVQLDADGYASIAAMGGSVPPTPTIGSDVSFLVNHETVATGGIVCVDVTVANFTNIGSMQFTTHWNPLDFSFVELQNLNTDLGIGLNDFGTIPTLLNNGNITFGWVPNPLVLHTLSDNDVLFSVCLNTIGTEGINSVVSITNTPTLIEVTDLVSVLPYDTFDGSITIGDNVIGIDNGSSDACGIANLSLDITSFNCSNIGTNTVTLTAMDVNGNASVCTSTVTIEDNVPPVAICQDITVNLDAAGNANITATDIDNGSNDACGSPNLSLDQTSFDCTDIGTNTVSLTATDASGNSSICTATVTIEDNIPPTAICQDITLNLDAAGNASITAADIDNGSNDACGSPNLSLDQTSFDCTDIGTNTVSLTATDASGNSSICTATVTIEDNIPPVAVCQDITVNLDAAGNASITAADIDNGSNDACGSPNLSLDQTSFDCTDIGTNTVSLTATDASGNSSICTATVTIEDNIPPTAICQDITLNLDAAGNASITAADIDNGSNDACGSPNLSLDQTSFDCTDIGTNTVSLTATDASGNSSICTATVTIEDNIPPTAICQDITLNLDAAGNASITAADIDNGSNDACGSPNLSLDQTSFDCTDIGTNTVSLTATDASGNSSICTATVTIEDNISPTAICQDITLNLDAAGNASITAADIDNGSNDACGSPNLSLDQTSFDCTDIGTNTVSLTATDASGNSSICTATVTIEDNISPTAICQDITLNLDAAGNASITAADIDNGSNDACGSPNLSLDQTSFDCTDIGTNTVSLTATDASGNSSICTATVTIEDNIPPTAICQDITLNLDAAGNASITAADIDNGSNDACGSPNLSLDQTSFDCTDIGTNTVSLTATDASGNSSICTATVTIEDNISPTAICQDITLNLDAAGNASITAADIDNGSNDACGSPNLSLDQTSFDCTDIGTNTVSLTATDASGNSSICTATVTIEDNIPPTAICQDITLNLDAAGNASITAADIDNGSNDACGSPNLSLDQTSFDCTDIGTNTVSLTATDASGNSSICTATVTIEDNISPTAICQDITLNLDAAGNASITAADIDNGSNDACGSPNLSLDQTSFDCTEIGTNTVSLTATDASGNSSICTATVTIEDNTPPTVICQDITVNLDVAGNASITAADIDNGSNDACGSPNLSLDQTSFDCTDIGTNTVSLTATDASGNSSICTATVTIEDNISPTAICQDITLNLDAAGNASITAADIDNGSNDACGSPNLSLDQTSFDCTEIGTNTVSLTATDASGNSSICTATVTIEDNTPPTVICQDITVNLDVAGNASITAADIDNGSNDACGSPNLSLDQTSFDCTDIGTNTVSLIATDASGNSSICTATVTIEDNIPPTAICQDITLNLDAAGNASITAADIDNGSNDACGSPNLSLDQTSFDCTDIGTNTVSLTATDASGNSSICTATVTIEDNIPPTAICQDITLNLDAAGNASITAADIDNGSNDACGSPNLSLDQTSFDCTEIGTNTVSLTATDASGNSSICTATVTIEDNIPPTAICQNITLNLDAAGTASITAADIDNSSMDNCAITQLRITSGKTTFSCLDIGQIYTLTLLATDATGNSATCTSNVTIVDDINPCCDITITNISANDETCAEHNDGSIYINAICNSCENGVNDIEYSIDGTNFYQNIGSFTNVPAGVYSITIRDVNDTDCSAVLMSTVTIEEPDILTTTINISNPISCNEGADGVLTVSATGGTLTTTSSFAYAWSNGATTPTISNLTVGMYSVTITDDNGCTASDLINLSAPSKLAITQQPSNVYSCGGTTTFSVNVTQGTQPYTYYWENENGTPLVGALDSPNYTFDASLSNTDQSYQVRIIDANGCMVLSEIACAYITTVDAGEDRTICSSESSSLYANTNAPLLEWTPSTGLSCTDCPNPIANPSITTTYTLTAKATVSYRATFINGVTPSEQAEDWCKFRAKLNPTFDYTRLTIRGSEDTEGITIDNIALVNGIANALRNGTPYSIVVGGNQWVVNIGCSNIFSQCNSTGGVALSVNATDCQCDSGSDVYTIRPEIGNGNWGGISGSNCNATTQEMEVIFEYDALGCTDQVLVTVEDCEPECPSSYLLTGTQPINADFETDGPIISQQVISSTIQVDYDSGECIDLLPGFEVQLGAEFDAFIDGCNEGIGGNQAQEEENRF